MLDTVVLGVPPPPVTKPAAALWGQLPPANRSRLLWLLSPLVERQLHVEFPSHTEDSNEPPADETCG